MATLTWRNVDSPNFADAMAGYRSSAEMLNNAFDSLRQGLGDFQAQRTADADSQVLANSLQFTDPAAYQEALKSGAILGGIDPTRVSSQAIGALASRAGTLINNSANEYDLNRAKETNAAMDAARPALVALAEANASGDPAKIAAAQQQYGSQLANLPAADILKTYLTGQSLEAGSLRNDATRFTIDTTARNDEDTQAAIALVNQIRENKITVDGARQELLAADLSAGARSKATELLGGMFPGMFGPIGSTPGAAPAPGGSAGSAAYDTVVGNGQFGSPSQPLSSMSIGQAIEFGQNVLIPGTRGNRQLGLPADKGSSAMGAFQITQQTLQDYAPKALGADWKDQPMSAANQDKIAEAIFNDRKQGNLADTWVSLPDKTPGAYADKSWEEMRQVIARGEVGMDLPSMQEVAAAQGQLGQRTMSNNAADGAAQDLVKNFGSNATVGSVTDQLVKGDFAGADANKVRKQIRKIMEMSASKEYGGTGSPSINAAQAGAILQRSIATSDPLAADGNTGLASFSWWDDEVGVSDDDVAAAVRNFNSGGSLDAALENQQVVQVSQMLTQAQQASQSAMNELVQAARRAQSQPGARDELPQFIQRAQQSSQRVQQLLDMQRRSPQFQANREVLPGNDAAAASKEMEDLYLRSLLMP